MRYLTFDEIVRIHSRMILVFGGEKGIVSEGAIENCVALPMLAVYEIETSPSLWTKAAVLLHCIATRHPFVDGNKRTAWGAARVFLILNGIRLKASTKNAEGIMRKVVGGEIDVDGLAKWIKLHSESIS